VLLNAAASRSAGQGSDGSRALLPVIFATMHLSWGGGFWTGVLFDKFTSDRSD
jgi:hypothetical protein